MLLHRLYRLLLYIGWPLIRLYMWRRLKKGKEHPERISERFGHPGCPRPEGALVWMHGASVGEALSMLPLIKLFRAAYPGLSILVTTGTRTSAALMEDRLPEGAFHHFVPIDHPACVTRFLDHFKPNMALFFESDFWPTLMMETAKRPISMVLLNGRISDHSFKRWQKHLSFIRPLLASFCLALGQTDEDAKRLHILGAPVTDCAGNLKYGAAPLPVDKDALASLNDAIGTRPVWLAASTHAGEDGLIADCHAKLKQTWPNLLTIIVPRHPHRGKDIASEIRGMDLSLAQRSKDEPLTDNTDIYLADTMGELGLFFRAAPIVFIGKSLLPEGGGQNPLEPALLGCAVLFGPLMQNFTDMTTRMLKKDAAIQVEDHDALTKQVAALLTDLTKRNAAGERAKQFAEKEAHVTEAVFTRLQALLAEDPPKDKSA